MTSSSSTILTTFNEGVHGIARRVLDPLCAETAKMLSSANLSPNDYMKVLLNDDGKKFVVKMLARLDGREVACSWNAKKWVNNVPERKEVGYAENELAATDITCLVLSAAWAGAESRIEWDPEARLTYDFLLARFLQQTIGSQQRALFKIRGEMPEIPEGWVEHPDKPLALYQRVGAVTMFEQEGSAAFCEQGTGKTPLAIAMVMNEAHRFYHEQVGKKRMFRCLVCCPKNVRGNWAREIASFATYPGMATVFRGGQLARMKLLVEAMTPDEDSEYTVLISSYETIERSWDALSLIEWDRVILDESHYIKWHRAKRTKRMLGDAKTQGLRDLAAKRTVMTGTPVCNSLMDLYTQLEFLGEGLSGFSSYESFREFYGKYNEAEDAKSQHGRKTLIGYQNLPFLQERLARLAFMITKGEALPELMKSCPKQYDMVSVSMTRRQAEVYQRVQDELALKMEDAERGTNKTMVINNILTMLLRLEQVTSGFVAWDPVISPDGDLEQAREIEPIEPNPKLAALMEIIESTTDKEKLLVWCCFKQDIRRISAELTARSIPHCVYDGSTKQAERDRIEVEFNSLPTSQMKVFVGNPGAGGTGLNLRGYDPDASEDHGCNVARVVYYSQDWSMVKRNQSEDRAHRRGTRVPVMYTTLMCDGTIDEVIHERLMKKTLTALEIQDVRDIMRRVLDTVPEVEE